ncbi:MAG: hypothetical protein K8T91_22570 [Planctomycetes bacterium]|nr:hypothetical protein [Planctomycetota bacterium]
MSVGREQQSIKPLALVVCDSVNADASNGKFHLIGTFDLINAATYPAAAKLGVYFAATDCRGKHSLQLKLVFSGEGIDDEEVMSADIELDEPDPIKTIQLALEIVSQIPKPGVYYLQVHCAPDGCIIERRLVAQQPQAPPQENI